MRSASTTKRLALTGLTLVAAGLACTLPGGSTEGEVATSVAATQAAAPTATTGALPTTAAPTGPGQVSGMVCYPSEPPLPPMTLYFHETVSDLLTAVPHTDGTGVYTVDLPEGSYVAFAWRDGNEIGGSYSQAVPCGLSAACTDHSLIAFNVEPGSTTSGVDICDWYGGPGAVPTPPGGAAPSPTATLPPPADGVSLNCDGTYQRFRLQDGGAAGKTAYLDQWDGAAWSNVWSLAGGDPMVRQITPQAGMYTFGGCQRLVIIPMVYTGSGAVLELRAFAWNGAALVEVYRHEGVHGEWSRYGSILRFDESIYLYGEPNCCPCNRQSLEHSWNGSTFTQTGSAVNPTYSGTPPPECIP